MRIKAHKEEALKEWINKLTATPQGNYLMHKLDAEGFSMVSTLESMRLKDLKLVLMLISSAYAAGADATRETFIQFRADRIKEQRSKQAGAA